MEQTNIDFNEHDKAYLTGKIDSMTFSLDFSYELDQRYNKMHCETTITVN